MNKKLLLIGGGGHCKTLIDSLQSMDIYESVGIVTNQSKQLTVLDKKIVGSDDELELLLEHGYTDAFIAVGSVGDSSLRRKLYDKIKKLGFYIPNIIDATALVSAYSQLGQGIFIGKNAIVNADTIIKDMVIINTNAVIEHDCIINEFTHVAPGVVICGDVRVGSDSHIGAHATVIQGIDIGSNVLVGAGSVVVRSLPDSTKCIGVPGRTI